MTFEERAAELAQAIALVCSEEPDVDVIASALVQFAGELAHRKRAVIVDALASGGREGVIDVQCRCADCAAARRAELDEHELLELDAPVPYRLVQP